MLNADYCITVPCDAPMLNGKVAEYLFDEINGSFVAVPMWPNGRLETLLMVLERKTLWKSQMSSVNWDALTQTTS